MQLNISLYAAGSYSSYNRSAVGGIAGIASKTIISESCNTGEVTSNYTGNTAYWRNRWYSWRN